MDDQSSWKGAIDGVHRGLQIFEDDLKSRKIPYFGGIVFIYFKMGFICIKIKDTKSRPETWNSRLYDLALDGEIAILAHIEQGYAESANGKFP